MSGKHTIKKEKIHQNWIFVCRLFWQTGAAVRFSFQNRDNNKNSNCKCIHKRIKKRIITNMEASSRRHSLTQWLTLFVCTHSAVRLCLSLDVLLTHSWWLLPCLWLFIMIFRLTFLRRRALIHMGWQLFTYSVQRMNFPATGSWTDDQSSIAKNIKGLRRRWCAYTHTHTQRHSSRQKSKPIERSSVLRRNRRWNK